MPSRLPPPGPKASREELQQYADWARRKQEEENFQLRVRSIVLQVLRETKVINSQ